ncbi:hypothetical protein [Bremerella cremea]|nr:hypothetical protein [Bremerella cremea]
MLPASSQWVVLPLLLLVPLIGCAKSSQQERVIPLKASASMEEARSLLENYAQGSPVTSEADSFDTLVEGVRKEDPKAANILSEAFKQIKENPGSRAKAAKNALKQLPAKEEPQPAAESSE